MLLGAFSALGPQGAIGSVCGQSEAIGCRHGQFGCGHGNGHGAGLNHAPALGQDFRSGEFDFARSVFRRLGQG